MEDVPRSLEDLVVESVTRLMESIEVEDEETTELMIEMLGDLDITGASSLFDYLTYFLRLALLIDDPYRIHAIRTLFSVFEAFYPNEKVIPLRSYVFALPMKNEYFDLHVHVCFPEITYREHVRAFFNYSDDIEIGQPLSRIDDTFRITDTDVIDSALEDLNMFCSMHSMDLPYTRQYLEGKLKEISPVAPLNKAVASMDELSSHTELVDEALRMGNDMEIKFNTYFTASIFNNASSVIKGEDLYEHPATTDGISILLSYAQEIMSSEQYKGERQALVSGGQYVSTELENDIHRRVGPCNPQSAYFDMNSDSDPSNPCLKCGGCRMFTCWHYAEKDDAEYERYDSEWFTGSCDFCNLQISYKHEAVRMPIKQGGWVGCYDRWDCVINDTTDLTTKAMCENFKNDYETVGIYDRYYSRPEEGVTTDTVHEVLNMLADTM